jgi:hypothetical protein
LLLIIVTYLLLLFIVDILFIHDLSLLLLVCSIIVVVTCLQPSVQLELVLFAIFCSLSFCEMVYAVGVYK